MNHDIDESTLTGLFDHTARLVKKRKLLLISPRTLSYGKALDEVGRLMQLFAATGLAKGDSIVLSVEEDAAVISLFLAAFRFGLPVTVIDVDATVHEARALFSLVDAKAVFCSKKVHAKWQLADVCLGLELKLHAQVDLETAGKPIVRYFRRKENASDSEIPSFPAMLQPYTPLVVPPEEPSLEDDAVRFFTSGTTGSPKVVRLSYLAVLSQADIMARQTRINSDSVLMSLFQFTQLGGLASGILLSFWNGATLCRPVRKFSYNDITLLMDSIYNKRVTHFYLVPAMMDLFLRFGSDLKQTFDTRDFKYFLCMAASLPRSLWEEFEAATGKEVINSYGLTEANNLTYSGPEFVDRDLDGVGHTVDCQMKVVSDDGRNLPAGEKGELLVKGPTMLADYYRNPEATNAVLKDGWFHTGDIATIDTTGNCRITGRIKDVIISGGYNVYPEELNTLLRRHPHVSEAHTFGMKSDIWGEEIVCCVVADEDDTDERDLIGYLRNHLSEFKVPKSIKFLDHIPISARGKVDRGAIERMISPASATTNPNINGGVKGQVIEVAAEAFLLNKSALQIVSAYNNTPGWDSLGHLMFVQNLEDRFSIKLEPMEILRVQTIADAIKIVEEKHEAVG